MKYAEHCRNMINTLVEYSCRKEFSGQMDIARELFAVATGKVTDEDPFFENRLSVFQHYFVFDFRLSEIFSGSTIFELFLLRLQSNPLRKNDVRDFEHFRSVRRSLFRVEKHLGESSVVARDLFARSQVTVHAFPEYTFSGFESGGVFEARQLCFRGENYFTASFVFHPREVTEIIEHRIREFLLARTFDSSAGKQNWESELRRRHELMFALAEQKRLVESSDKRKAVEVLNVNKCLAKLANEVGNVSLVMAIGSQSEVSAFVPETPFYDTAPLMDALSYSELKCCRFKHIMPQKLYAPDNNELRAGSQSKTNPVLAANEKSA